MHLFPNTDTVGAELSIGDLFRSKRGIHSLLINIYEDSLTVLTEAGRCYTVSREQLNVYSRLANVDIIAYRFDCVFGIGFVADLVKMYKSEAERKVLINQLSDIPDDVLQAALNARKLQKYSPKA